MQGADATVNGFTEINWDLLFQDAQATAQKQVNRLSWRGARGGVLPHGYDPNSIAAEAVLKLLKEKPWPGDTPPPQPDLAQQLRRRVWREVDRLHHLKENFVTFNEPDLAPAFFDDGQAFSVFDIIPAPDPTPLQNLIQKEKDAEFAQFQAEFNSYLGRGHRLKRLFAFLCDGISNPRDLARRLKTRIQAIANLKKRLRRRLLGFFAAKTSAQINSSS